MLDTLDPPDQPGYDPADDLRTLEELWRARLDVQGADLYNPARKR